MKFLIFFLMLPHMKPISFEYLWTTIGQLFDIGRLISTFVIIFLYFLKKRFPSKPIWILAVLQFWLLFATYHSGGNLRGNIVGSASILAISMLVDFFSGNPIALLKGLMLNFEIFAYCNLASVLLAPSGLYISEYGNPGYFFGHRNQTICFVLPAIVISLMYIYCIGKKLRPMLLIISSCLQIFIVWSATSICALMILGTVVFLSKTSLNKWITYPVIFISTTVIDLLISVFRVMDRVLLFTAFIESFLHKSVTLTGRTFIWDSAYQRFFHSPWIGHGKGAESIIGTGLSSHNQWFQFLLEGGIVGLIIFLVFNLIIGKQLMQYKNSSFSGIFYASFAALYILFVADVYLGSPWLYIIYILAYHIDKFETALVAGQFQISKIKRGYHVPNRKLPEKH